MHKFLSKLKMVLLVALTGIFFSSAYCQDTDLLTRLPSTKDEFIKSEKVVINTINWLENNPRNENEEQRKLLMANLIAWLTNSPTVTIELNSKTIPFSKKNEDLLIIFMGGWTKYSLQNNYSKDQVKGTYAGIKSAIRVYQMGNGIKKDKQMEKLIELDSKNELEKWIIEQLSKK